MTLDAAFARYWNEHGQYLPSAFDVIHPNAKQMIGFFGKDKYLDEIDDAAISNFKTHLRANPIGQPGGKKKIISNGTINRKLDTLSAVLHRARKQWGVDGGEVDIAKHKLRIPEARTRWITPAEADKLIAAAPPHLAPCIRFALLTGVRLSNITQLQWEQVNMHARIIRFQVKSRNPGGKLHEIPIGDALFALLLEQQPRKSGHVFLRRFKKDEKTGYQREPVPIIQFRRSFQQACKNAGITDFRFHDLRHTAASWMIQNGVPLDVVQQVLGHAHLSMTQKYAHRNATDKANALDALAKTQIGHNQKGKKNAK